MLRLSRSFISTLWQKALEAQAENRCVLGLIQDETILTLESLQPTELVTRLQNRLMTVASAALVVSVDDASGLRDIEQLELSKEQTLLVLDLTEPGVLNSYYYATKQGIRSREKEHITLK